MITPLPCLSTPDPRRAVSDQFLSAIAAGSLLYLASDSREIHQVAVLRAAGLVTALVPHLGRWGYRMNASVLAITQEGRVRLAGSGAAGSAKAGNAAHQ
jgi:hypothetical protein